MNGVHDLGGMHGFGPVEREPNEPLFHEPWEGRAFGTMMLGAAAGLYNVDEIRHAIERMGQVEYLSSSYYEHWIHAMEDLMAAKGVTAEAKAPPAGLNPPLPKAMVETALATGATTRMDVNAPPRFQPGDKVVAKNINPPTHTRLPRYIRGKTGVVEAQHGGFAFADTRAHGRGEKPQHVYSVRFSAQELWGPEASAKDAVYIDLWDDYIDPA
jgi:nitrile hydratase subunit beta